MEAAKTFLEKAWTQIYERIGIAAIFLAMMIFMYVQMLDMMKRQDERLIAQLSDWQTRFERLEDKSERTMQRHLEAIKECCRDYHDKNLARGTQ